MIYDKINTLFKRYCICRIYRMCDEYEIDYEDVKKTLSSKEKCVLIDVRSKQEYKEGHLDNSINIPIYEIKKKIDNFVMDKQTDIFLYCQTGNRSIRAISILSKMGFENLYSIKGGLDNIVTQ